MPIHVHARMYINDDEKLAEEIKTMIEASLKDVMDVQDILFIKISWIKHNILWLKNGKVKKNQMHI